jgi:hypothetical protein
LPSDDNLDTLHTAMVSDPISTSIVRLHDIPFSCRGVTGQLFCPIMLSSDERTNKLTKGTKTTNNPTFHEPIIIKPTFSFCVDLRQNHATQRLISADGRLKPYGE